MPREVEMPYGCYKTIVAILSYTMTNLDNIIAYDFALVVYYTTLFTLCSELFRDVADLVLNCLDLVNLVLTTSIYCNKM